MKAVYLERKAITEGDIDFTPITSLMETEIFDNTTEENKYDHIGDADFVFVNKIIMDEELFERCPNLKYIGVCATGYNCVDVAAATKRGITVTYVPSYSTDSVAQLAFLFILESAGKMILHNESVKKGEWINADRFCYWLEPIIELSGKSLGIIGFGNIGRRVAEIAKAFHMNVYAYTRNPDKYKDYEYEGESFLRFVSQDELLEKSDYISLHCPMNEHTGNMINEETINKMKDGAVLINVSRGGLIDENAVASALNSGKLSFFGADVVKVEPMRADNPLKDAKNAVITPHLAWASIEARTRLINTIADNFKAYLNGEKKNVVSS
ncbi:MAG: D-2-hydroxyacid dehydrogenase [Lachnospiraceae bacterium]|nr:D-2-hydroxyacid dehydrogenase [Lachnospiraceae bacterium]